MFMGVALTGRFSKKNHQPQKSWSKGCFDFFGIYLGVGGSLYWCFGIVYLDDNMGKANSPFMLR